MIKIWGKVLYGKKFMQNSEQIWDRLKKKPEKKKKKKQKKNWGKKLGKILKIRKNTLEN